jgi:hypothetical protein
MHVAPAPAAHLLGRGAGVVVPAPVEPLDGAVGLGDPGELGDALGKGAELLLPLAQRGLGPPPAQILADLLAQGRRAVAQVVVQPLRLAREKLDHPHHSAPDPHRDSERPGQAGLQGRLPRAPSRGGEASTSSSSSQARPQGPRRARGSPPWSAPPAPRLPSPAPSSSPRATAAARGGSPTRRTPPARPGPRPPPPAAAAARPRARPSRRASGSP